MLDQDDLWWMEELPVEDPSELLTTMPEIRQYLDPSHDERAFRSILEQPDALSRAWRRDASKRKRKQKARRRSAAVLHAA